MSTIPSVHGMQRGGQEPYHEQLCRPPSDYGEDEGGGRPAIAGEEGRALGRKRECFTTR